MWDEFVGLKRFAKKGLEDENTKERMAHQKSIEFIDFLEESLVFILRNSYQ